MWPGAKADVATRTRTLVALEREQIRDLETDRYKSDQLAHLAT